MGSPSSKRVRKQRTDVDDSLKSVPRTGRGVDKAKEWYFLRGTDKSYHAVGRTSRGMDSITTQDQIDDLASEMGYVNEVYDMSKSMQLDFLTTEFLRQDRATYQRVNGRRHIGESPYLSSGQWYVRARKEVVFASVEALETLMKHPKFRRQNMGDRITRLPFDKQGNLPFAWTRSPMRVGRDPDYEPRGNRGFQ